MDVDLLKEVVLLTDTHNQLWRREGDLYWLARLMEEVGELSSALVDNHEDPPEWELRQIASICLNWLDYRMSRGYPVLHVGRKELDEEDYSNCNPVMLAGCVCAG